MKKILALAAIAFFTITSCSDDSSSPTDNTNTDGVMLKKMIVTADGETITSQFSYDGTKLTGITNSDGTNEVITYSGNDIISWKKFDGTTLLEEYQYIYDSFFGTLEEEIYTNHENGTSLHTDFEYSDNTISFYNTELGFGTYTHNSISHNSGSQVEVNYVVTYDGKNNPYKNITGLSKIYFWRIGWSTNYTENVVTQTRVMPNDPDDLLDTHTYTYNSLNYPLTEVVRDHESNDIITSSTQYFYE